MSNYNSKKERREKDFVQNETNIFKSFSSNSDISIILTRHVGQNNEK